MGTSNVCACVLIRVLRSAGARLLVEWLSQRLPLGGELEPLAPVLWNTPTKHQDCIFGGSFKIGFKNQIFKSSVLIIVCT